jgi:hypothetical protein
LVSIAIFRSFQMIRLRLSTGKIMIGKRAPFGKAIVGIGVDLYTLTNKQGMETAITNYGATLVVLKVPDQHGKPMDVTVGFEQRRGVLDPVGQDNFPADTSGGAGNDSHTVFHSAIIIFYTMLYAPCSQLQLIIRGSTGLIGE